DFWGSWCSPCLAESPEMRKLAADLKDRLKIVGLIANDTKEKALAAIKSRPAIHV
ncbi:MAG: redoxin domain-containing protein, partial [Sphingobacteriaceae bacterium]